MMAEKSQPYKRATHSQPRPGMASRDGTGRPFTRSNLAGHRLQQSHAALRSGKKVPSVRLQRLPSIVLKSLKTQTLRHQRSLALRVRVASAAPSSTSHDDTTMQSVQTPGPGAEVRPLKAPAKQGNELPRTVDVHEEMPFSSHALRHDHSYSYGVPQGLQQPEGKIKEKLRQEISDLRHKLKLAHRKVERARQSLERERRMHNETQQTLQALMNSIQFQVES